MTTFEQRLEAIIGKGSLSTAAAILNVDAGILLFWPFGLPDSALATMSDRLNVPLHKIREEFADFITRDRERFAHAYAKVLVELLGPPTLPDDPGMMEQIRGRVEEIRAQRASKG